MPIIHVNTELATVDCDWRTVDDGVDMERYMVTELVPDSLYQFRIAPRNELGWGEFSVATAAVRTGRVGRCYFFPPIILNYLNINIFKRFKFVFKSFTPVSRRYLIILLELFVLF